MASSRQAPYPRIVAIGGSAGSIAVLRDVVHDLPRHVPAAVVLAIHLPPAADFRSRLPEWLAPDCRLPVDWARDGEPVTAGTLRIAPQDAHLALGDEGRWRIEPAPQRPRPGIDRLFASIAARCGADALGVVLSGYLADGAAGARAMLERGGTVLVQDRASALVDEMPRATLRAGGAALVLPPRLLGRTLATLLMAPGAQSWFRVSAGSCYASEAVREFEAFAS